MQIVSFRRQFVWNVKSYFLGKIKKSIPNCCLLTFLPSMLIVRFVCLYFWTYRSVNAMLLLLQTKGQGQRLRNFVNICAKVLHSSFAFAHMSENLHFNFHHSLDKFRGLQFGNIFPRKWDRFDISCKLSPNIFLLANCLMETICMKHQILFSGKNKKNKYCLLKILPRVLSIKFITKTYLFKYTENFTTKKMKIFR